MPVHAWRPWICALLFAACQPGVPASDAPEVLNVPEDAIHVVATPDVVSRVVDVQPTADGRVWILNATEPFFVVLGPDGRVERQFGERGGGPEEFGGPLALVRGTEPSAVWTFDLRRNGLIRISGTGRRALPLSRDSIPISSLISFKGAGVNPAPPWVESSGEGFLLARARVSRPESALHLWNADILLVREDGPQVAIDLYAPLADFLGDPTSGYGDATVLLPYPLWTVCADGTIGLYDPLANALRRLDREGDVLDSVGLPEERRVQMTPDLVFGMFYRQLAEDAPSTRIPDEAEMRRLTEEQNRLFVSSSTETFPEYSDLRCTPHGTFWLRLFDAGTGRLGWGPDWVRVAPDGSRALVALPDTFRAFRFEADRIWGTVRDALGVASIAWIGSDAVDGATDA